MGKIKDTLPESQIDMSDFHARARTTDPETSHEAAATVDVKKDAKRVLDFIVEIVERVWSVGFTLKLLANYAEAYDFEISPSGLRTRVSELRKAGYIEWATDDEGNQMYDSPVTGRRSRMMRLTAKGRGV
jgi:hypothetical protein